MPSASNHSDSPCSSDTSPIVWPQPSTCEPMLPGASPAPSLSTRVRQEISLATLAAGGLLHSGRGLTDDGFFLSYYFVFWGCFFSTPQSTLVYCALAGRPQLPRKTTVIYEHFTRRGSCAVMCCGPARTEVPVLVGACLNGSRISGAFCAV